MSPKFSELSDFACGKDPNVDTKLSHQAFDVMKQDIYTALNSGGASKDFHGYPEGKGILAVNQVGDGTTEYAHLDKFNGVIRAMIKVNCPEGSSKNGIILFDGDGALSDGKK